MTPSQPNEIKQADLVEQYLADLDAANAWPTIEQLADVEVVGVLKFGRYLKTVAQPSVISGRLPQLQRTRHKRWSWLWALPVAAAGVTAVIAFVLWQNSAAPTGELTQANVTSIEQELAAIDALNAELAISTHQYDVSLREVDALTLADSLEEL
ncbi:MAG: hypothetical protein HYV33_00610 [Candidatus Kerfeldbacteria bacterium]|nr:hypothetical protein [Candidatus Kerfeldbacteria bacterium]